MKFTSQNTPTIRLECLQIFVFSKIRLAASLIKGALPWTTAPLDPPAPQHQRRLPAALCRWWRASRAGLGLRPRREDSWVSWGCLVPPTRQLIRLRVCRKTLESHLLQDSCFSWGCVHHYTGCLLWLLFLPLWRTITLALHSVGLFPTITP